MKVLILCRSPQLPSIRRLVEETTRAGHQAHVLDPEDPELKKASGDVIIPRFGTWKFEESLAALEHFERRGTPVLNRASSLREARNKWISSLVLREEGLPMPATSLASRKDLPRQYPYVAKILRGSKGDGVFLVSGPADHLALPTEEEWLVQEYVREAAGRDHRLIVVEGKVIAAMERRAPAGEFRSNIAVGGTAHSHEPSSLEIKIAVEAAKALRLRVAGVDLIPSRGGPLLLEVNGSPGIEGIEAASAVNVAGAIVESALRLVPA